MIVKSLDHLNKISELILKKLDKKDCLFLIGEIGVGKTTLTRYLINNLQKQKGLSLTEVLSPTFNLLYEYEINDFKIMHYDLYRIKETKELKHLGIFSEELDAVKIVEWPNLIKTTLQDKLEVYLRYSEGEKENVREIEFKGQGKWKNFKNEI